MEKLKILTEDISLLLIKVLSLTEKCSQSYEKQCKAETAQPIITLHITKLFFHYILCSLSCCNVIDKVELTTSGKLENTRISRALFGHHIDILLHLSQKDQKIPPYLS